MVAAAPGQRRSQAVGAPRGAMILPFHNMSVPMFPIRAGWLAGCVLAIGVGAVRLAQEWPSLAFIDTLPMVSSGLYLADRPGSSSKALAELAMSS